MGGRSPDCRAPGVQAWGAACPPCMLVLSQDTHSVSPWGMSQMSCQPLPSTRPQPRGCLAMPGDIFGCHSLEGMSYWY